MLRKGFVGLLFMSLMATVFPASAALLGTWDLRGTGQKDMVYREGSVLRVIQPGGGQRDYSFGAVSWALVQVADTNGSKGMEMIVRAGNDLVIISHANTSQRKYSVGNFAWAVMEVANLDNKPGNEVLLSIGNGIRVINDTTQSHNDLNFTHNGSWSLFAVADLAGTGLELVLNMGNGVKLINPRTMAYRDFTFPGFTSIFGVAQLDAKAGLEVIGRTQSDVYVISGGVAKASLRNYTGSNSSNWAIYGRTADTDGKAGDEIILTMPGAVRIIRHASGGSRDYQVGSANFAIDSVSNIDGVPGEDILVRSTSGQIYLINDRNGSVTQQ